MCVGIGRPVAGSFFPLVSHTTLTAYQRAAVCSTEQLDQREIQKIKQSFLVKTPKRRTSGCTVVPGSRSYGQ